MRTRLTLTLCLAALACLASGCSFYPTGSTTNITVQYTSDSLLHMAHLPAELENGTPADELQQELMEQLAESAEVVTVMPAEGSVLRDTEEPAETEPVHLLMAQGPPEIAMVIWRFLRQEYDIERPWVVSLPTQPVARVAVPQVPADAPDADADMAEGE
jgi:hypothetical protein